jgi:hypothetical protein
LGDIDNMAIVSAFSTIRALSLFHITLAFYFLTNPRIIAEQNLVVILGEAMDLVSKNSTLNSYTSPLITFNRLTSPTSTKPLL